MKKYLAAILSGLIVSGTILSTASAQQAVDPSFNPNLLITDAAFSDAQTFGSAAAIQSFLAQHGSALADTSQNFLSKLREPDTATKQALEDPEPNLGRMRTAAELIFDASTKTGLNPQVILVTLQKEQTLITGNFSGSDLQRALDRAMGFGCPDSGGCGDMFLGFYRQLFGTFDAEGNRYLGAASSLMRSFNTTDNAGKRIGRGPEVDANGATSGPAVRTARVGDTISLPNTLGGYSPVSPVQSVLLSNSATAALYRYTPHVFNGNYNFWKYYTLWFKYPNGTVIHKIGETGLFVIDNGTKRFFSQFVAQQRKINLSQVIAVSPTEFDTYITETPLTPLDGTLIKGDANATVYLTENGFKKPISGSIFTQRRFSFGKVVTLPQAEVDSYATGPLLAPFDGTLITGTSDATVYIIENGIKRPITYNVFVARNLSFKNLLQLSDGEVAAIQSGPFLNPPDGVQVKLSDSTGIFWYKDGQKRFVSAFVYNQRSVYNFPTVVLGADEFEAIPTGTPFPPKDGTIVKGDASDGIYQVNNGLLNLLTPVSYSRLRSPKPTILPQSDIDSFAKGETIAR